MERYEVTLQEKRLFRLVLNGLSTLDNHHDLTAVLAERKSMCYMDVTHISEECNKVVAEEIFRIISAELPEPPSSEPPKPTEW